MEAIKFQTRASSKGECSVFIRKKGEKEFKLVRHVKNLTVNLGLNLIRDNVFGSQSNYVQWGAVSDDANTPTASDTSLGGNEIRKAFQSGYPDNSVDYESIAEFYIDGTDWANGSPSALTTVSKAGLYYQSSGNYLYCAASFDSINVDADTEMLVRWKVIFSDV